MDYKAEKTINPAFAWAGSKWRIGPRLIELFPDHNRYVELFAGTASVLLRKKESNIEYINDINDELVNFYLVIQNDFHAFISKVMFMLKAESMHKYFLELQTNDKILRAVRFYYLTKYGLVSGDLETSGLIIPRISNKRIGQRINNLYAFAERLKNVIVLNRDYSAVIDFLDSPETLFFCDPPYLDDSNLYQSNFGLKEHILLRDRLKKIEGKFLLTLNVSRTVYDLYKDWANIRTFTALYSTFQKKEHVNNYIITNYAIEPSQEWIARIL